MSKGSTVLGVFSASVSASASSTTTTTSCCDPWLSCANNAGTISKKKKANTIQQSHFIQYLIIEKAIYV